MLFKFNNKTGDMEISFSKEEAKIIMKKRKFIVSANTSKELIDNIALIAVQMAEQIIEHTGNKQTEAGKPVNITDDKSSK